jgi:hypothetical protein
VGEPWGATKQHGPADEEIDAGDSVAMRLRPCPMVLPKPLHPVVDGPFVVMSDDILTALDDSELLHAHVAAGGPLTIATREQAAGARRAAAGREDVPGGAAGGYGMDA